MSSSLAKFTVKPGKWNPYKPAMGFYYHVHVFSTKQEMWEAGVKFSPWEKDKAGGYGALTIPRWAERFTEAGVGRTAPKIGDVLFCKEVLGSGCICHEAVHMSTSYLRVLNKLQLSDQIDDGEELLAYCVGSCTRQIVDSLYSLEIL